MRNGGNKLSWLVPEMEYIDTHFLGKCYLDVAAKVQGIAQLEHDLAVVPAGGVDLGLEWGVEMLDDREPEVTLVMSEAHMGRQLKGNALEYELDQRVLQAVADLYF